MPKIRELISEEKVNQRIAEMGEQISRDYEGKEIHLNAILNIAINNPIIPPSLNP